MILRALPFALAGLLCLPLLACDSDAGGESLPAGCTVALSPGDDDFEALQTAFAESRTGDTICLRDGTYSFDRRLTLAASREITLRGLGATRDDVVLDFAGQTLGGDGMTVTADGFTISDLTIKNTPGNGIVVHADASLFRNIKVTWDAGSVTDNGAYAVYPNDCTRTIVEDSEISGASDAGIYVGSCEHAIVRRNTVHGNVAGIEIENSRHADVYENVVFDNTAGILVFALPNLAIKEVREVLVRDNHIYANNRPNFARAGTVVSYVPAGLGMLLITAKDVEIRDNVIEDQDGAAVLIVSFDLIESLTGGDITNTDPALDPYSEGIYIHSNTFTGNGERPGGTLVAIGAAPHEDVLWDGDVREAEHDPEICLGSEPPSFLNFAGLDPDKHSRDVGPHTCSRPALPTLTSFDHLP